MHNNKPIKNHDQGFLYVRKKDLDNAITYGLFNNVNEKEEYTCLLYTSDAADDSLV